jgi:MerR family transcriptional regulator, heat shock protein HspR
MAQDYYYKREVIEIFQCDEGFLDLLVDEDLVRPVSIEQHSEAVFTPEELERVRIIKNLIQELDVNIPGVEVILSMRENMILMQNQFYEILETLVKELKHRLPE